MLYQDIPRIYTAIAEWGSCLVYLYILKKENMKSVHFFTGSLFMLAMQSIFLTLTGSVTEILWIPCMMIAAGMMYIFLMVGGNMKPLGAAYCCARARQSDNYRRKLGVVIVLSAFFTSAGNVACNDGKNDVYDNNDPQLTAYFHIIFSLSAQKVQYQESASPPASSIS